MTDRHAAAVGVSPRTPVRAPAWFRYGVVALATLLMCSCSSAQRAKGDEPAGVVEFCPSPQSEEIFNRFAEEPPEEAAEVFIECGPDERPTDLDDLGACAVCGPQFIRGPRDEYLCDGGDGNSPAAVRRDRGLDGLEQEDTVIHYDTPGGKTYLTPSNRVCIYAPRFAVVRQVVDLQAYGRYEMVEGAVRRDSATIARDREGTGVRLASLEPTINRRREPPSLLKKRGHAGELARDRRPGAAIGSLAPYANFVVVQTGEVRGRDVVKIARSSLAAITWTGHRAAQVFVDVRQAVAEVSVQSPGAIYHLRDARDSRLRLIKLASTDHALPGEEVEFTLRFDNLGTAPLEAVTIVDHLTTRLELVEESQKCTLDAAFSRDEADNESLTLRWTLDAPLEPKQGGVIQFRCRVK